MKSQETFDFGFDKSAFKELDFILSESNKHAFSLISAWPRWDSKILLLYGPAASGKTHLCRIWQKKSEAISISAEDIYKNNLKNDKNYILENIEKVHDESSLFHFFNHMKEGSGFLLMTAQNNPQNLGIRLADLRSRINAVQSIGVANPDNALLRTIFAKNFSDRQLKVDMEVINYIISRMQRSFEEVARIVDVLDKQALKEKKNITIPFVRSILEKA